MERERESERERERERSRSLFRTTLAERDAFMAPKRGVEGLQGYLTY